MQREHLINKLIKENTQLNEELNLLKLNLKDKKTKQTRSIPIRFYLNDKIIRLVKRCIEKLKEKDPISGWFVYLLSITGCRGVEIQNVNLLISLKRGVVMV
ncbi:Integrase protein family protein, partial (plasmid) [Borrelia coriaceae ATCC 43381]